MFKTEFGITICPEKISLPDAKRYLLKAEEYGFNRLYLSFATLTSINEFRELKSDYQKIIRFAKRHNFFVVGEVNSLALIYMKAGEDNLGWFEEFGLDCVKLHDQINPWNIAQSTHQDHLNFALNPSGQPHYLGNVLDYRPQADAIGALHNFYGQTASGLSWEDFVATTLPFVHQSFRTGAFVSGVHKGIAMPQYVTVESHRYKPLRTQVKELLASNLIADVYVASPLSETEFMEITSIDFYHTELDMKLWPSVTRIERDILLDRKHYASGEAHAAYVKSGYQSTKLKRPLNITPARVQKEYHRGDVIIINFEEKEAEGQLMIIKTDGFKGFDRGQANLVGQIATYDLDLMDRIKPWEVFRLRIID